MPSGLGPRRARCSGCRSVSEASSRAPLTVRSRAVQAVTEFCRTAGWHLVARTRKDRVCDGYYSHVIPRIDDTFIVVGARNRSMRLGAMWLRLGVDSTDPLRTRIPCNASPR